MKKVLLSGYYGFKNIGDEAILYSIISALKNDFDIKVLSNDPKHTEQTYGVKAFNRWDKKEIKKAIKETDIVISGGGSLLQDVTSIKNVCYYLGIVLIAKFYKKKVVYYSQGIGPLNKKISKVLVKYVSNKADKIFVRDEKSKKLLNSIGVKKDKVEVSIDPVMGLDAIYEKKGIKILEKYNLNNEDKIIGISVRPWDLPKNFDQELVSVLDYLNELGYKIVFIPMHFNKDVKRSKEVNKQFNNKGIIINEELNVEQTIGLMQNLDYVIGMRLHSIIMSAVAKTGFVGLSYDIKVDNFIKEQGNSIAYDVNKIDSKEIINYLDENLKKEFKTNENLKEKALKPYKYLKNM